jgi:hypothetical protein
MIDRGILLALLSAALFGASTPLAKLLLGSVDPWLMAGLLYLGAGTGLAGVHLSRALLRLPAVEAPLRRSDVSWLALVILAGGVMGLVAGVVNLILAVAHGASIPRGRRYARSRHCRVLRLWRQPRLIRAGAEISGHRAHRSLFLACSFRRQRLVRRPAG